VRVVLQRVSRGEVRVDGEVVGACGRGFVLLVGFTEGDDEAAAAWVADKIVGLRVFPDDGGRMNRDLSEVGGDLLVVSQFTLYGDVRKGRRPSFVHAAAPDRAEALYETFVGLLRDRAPGDVATGRFGAHMEVDLVNDGPVTLVIER
jgi:D-tyrosyl-tRNA(Tyr) deacylase